MKKERSGLRYREYLTICGVLYFPCWLVLCDIYPKWSWREYVIFFAWSLGASILACLTQDRLEANGRYVDSAIDISWKDVSTWLVQDVYKVSLLVTFWCCFWIAVDVATGASAWDTVVMAGLAALNAYLAVVGKPTTK